MFLPCSSSVERHSDHLVLSNVLLQGTSDLLVREHSGFVKDSPDMFIRSCKMVFCEGSPMMQLLPRVLQEIARLNKLPFVTSKVCPQHLEPHFQLEPGLFRLVFRKSCVYASRKSKQT
jgi:hypothetical protein